MIKAVFYSRGCTVKVGTISHCNKCYIIIFWINEIMKHFTKYVDHINFSKLGMRMTYLLSTFSEAELSLLSHGVCQIN